MPSPARARRTLDLVWWVLSVAVLAVLVSEKALMPSVFGFYSSTYLAFVLLYVAIFLWIRWLSRRPPRFGDQVAGLAAWVLVALVLMKNWQNSAAILVVVHTGLMAIAQTIRIGCALRASWRWKDAVARMALLTFASVISIVAAEFAVRLISPQLTPTARGQQVVNIWRTDSLLPKTLAANVRSERLSPDGRRIVIETNSQGLRDTEVPLWGPPTILVLGDSFTFGWGVSNGETFPDVLESLTHVNVLNAGYRGDYSMDTQYLYLVKEGFTFTPDVVILAVFPYNDFIEMRDNEHVFRDGRFERIVSKRGGVDAGIPISTAVRTPEASWFRRALWDPRLLDHLVLRDSHLALLTANRLREVFPRKGGGYVLTSDAVTMLAGSSGGFSPTTVARLRSIVDSSFPSTQEIIRAVEPPRLTDRQRAMIVEYAGMSEPNVYSEVARIYTALSADHRGWGRLDRANGGCMPGTRHRICPGVRPRILRGNGKKCLLTRTSGLPT